jgi:hypothetical protein
MKVCMPSLPDTTVWAALSERLSMRGPPKALCNFTAKIQKDSPTQSQLLKFLRALIRKRYGLLREKGFRLPWRAGSVHWQVERFELVT